MKFYPPFPHRWGLEWAERNPVPLWVLHWVWMQWCTSSLVISQEMYFPALCHWTLMIRSRKPGDSDIGYYGGCLIWGEFEARMDASDCLRLYRMLVLAREEKEGGERCEERTGSWRHLSLPETRRKVTNSPFILNFTAGAKTSVCFQKFGLNLIINKWCLGSGFTQTLAAEVSIFREIDI